ncbi:MAG: acyl-ACP thioesterase domain-containing protein [Bacilli bacterium]
MEVKKLMKSTEPCTFYISDMDIHDCALPSHILQKFQDIAVINATELGAGYDDLIADDRIWVVTKIRYTVLKQVKENTPMLITTWPQPKGVMDFCRDYLITDKSGEVYIKGTSKWCITNIKTRRLVRARDFDYLNGNGTYCLDKNYEDPYYNLRPFDYSNLKPALTHQVRYTDLDHNMHMNNTNFASLAINSIEDIEKYTIEDMQVNFLCECLYKDTIRTYVKRTSEFECEVIGVKNEGILSFHTFMKLKHI